MYCLYMESEWEKIKKDHPAIELVDYDADENAEIHKKYGIKEIPSLIFLNDDGEEIIRLEGARAKEEIVKVIKESSKR